MSPFFIKEYKKTYKCGACSAVAKTGRKFCISHLEIAKERFARWSQERRAMGRCILCNRPGYNNQLRCGNHRAAMKRYWTSWFKENAGNRRFRWAEETERRRNDNLCTKCGKRSPRAVGRTRCQPCADYQTRIRTMIEQRNIK